MASQVRKFMNRVSRLRLPRINAVAAVCLVLCSAFYLLLLWQLWHAGVVGSFILTLIASLGGPVVCVSFARMVPRILQSSKGNCDATLPISLIVVIAGVGVISYAAFYRIPTGSWVTGIGSMSLMGPLVCIPASLYLWNIARNMTSRM